MLKSALIVKLAGLSALLCIRALAAPCSANVPAGATALEVRVDYPLFEPEERKLLVTVNGPVSREAVVEAEQTLAMTGIPAGRYSVSMLRPGFVLASGGQEAIQDVARGVCQQVILALKGAQAISGTLYDAFAKPITGVQVKLSRADDSLYATSDARGHFGFREVTPGPYWISTGSDGFAEQFYPVVADQDEASVIYVKPGEDVENVHFYVPHVSRTRSVSVRILHDDGSPVPGAKVALQPAQGEDRRGVERVADAEGRAEFQAFAESPYVVTASEGQGLSARAAGTLEIPAGAGAVTGTVQLRATSPRTATAR